jgi:hypothetical protein
MQKIDDCKEMRLALTRAGIATRPEKCLQTFRLAVTAQYIYHSFCSTRCARRDLPAIHTALWVDRFVLFLFHGHAIQCVVREASIDRGCCCTEAYAKFELANLGFVRTAYKLADPMTKHVKNTHLDKLLDTGVVDHPVEEYITRADDP